MPLTNIYCDRCNLPPTPLDQYHGGCSCVPDAVVGILRNKMKNTYHEGPTLSASALTTCPRKFYLERTKPYDSLLREEYWSVRGTMIHQVFEGYNPNWECEVVYYADLPELKLRLFGTADAYNPSLRELDDYKTMDDNNFKYLKGQAKEEHIIQTNVYRWLMMNGKQRLGKQPSKKDLVSVRPVDVINIWYIGMKRCIRTGQAGWVEEGFGYNKKLVRVEMSPVEILPMDTVRSMILERSEAILKGFRDGTMPPMVDPDHTWLCKFCKVKPYCDQFEEGK